MYKEPTTFTFEYDGYLCEATIEYTPSQSKWEAVSDVDYLGGYDVLELNVYLDDELQETHDVSHDRVVREYEFILETQMVSMYDNHSQDNFYDDYD